jgi:hypothetical protein
MTEQLQFLEPWQPAGDQALLLERQLAREVGFRHPLFLRTMRAIARRQDCDDVLYASPDGRLVAVVHLTWGRRRWWSAECPSVELFESFEAWLERGMMVDHHAFT